MSDTVAPTLPAGNPASSRIDPDTKGVQWTVVGLVGLLGLTSFIVSFRALHDVAAWAGIGPGLQWAVPVFIDGAILTYALAVLVHRSRGESVWPSWVSLAVFTAMSVAANAAHAVAAPQEQWWQTLVGAVLAALAPLGVFAATEQMARLVVLRPQDRQPMPVTPAVVDTAPEGASAPEADPSADTEDTPGPVAPVTEQALPIAAGPQPEVIEVEPVDSPAPTAERAEEPASEPQSEGVEPEQPREAAEKSPEPESVPEEAPTVEDEVSEEPSDEDFAGWVREQRRLGEPITGPTAGAFLGVSERTGRNRIKELRAARPELFEEAAA